MSMTLTANETAIALNAALVPPGAIALSTPYLQTFDSLANTGTNLAWTDSQTLEGWYASRTTYSSGTGSSNTGALYSFGASNGAERALGSVASGSTGTVVYGVRFFNDADETLTSLFLSYIGEQWRNGGNTTQHQLDFAYQVGATGLTSGTWVNFDPLDFVGPIASSTAGALDGNASANRVSLSGTVSGFTLAPGEEIWFRWSDIDNAGADHGLAIDNFQVTRAAAASIVLQESGGSTEVNEAGETTDTYTLALQTTPTAPVRIEIAAPDGQTLLSKDGIGFASTLTVELTDTTPQTITVKAVNDTTVEGSPHGGVITHSVTSADASYSGLVVPNVNVSILDNDVAISVSRISEIQGSGLTANGLGETRTIEGVVVGAFLGGSGLSGFYVQEEDADWDNDDSTSEGIFVFDPTGLFSGTVGDKVRVTGLVGEFTTSATGITGSTINSSLTQLSLANTVATRSVANLGASTLPSVTNVTLPVADASVLERYEGMLVNILAANDEALTVTNNFTLGRFGQVGLSAGDRLFQYTQTNAPSVEGYQAYLNDLLDNYIILDDGSNTQNPATVIHARNGQPLSATNTLRGGDTVSSITGVLDQRFEGYRVQTTAPVNFTAANPRENTAPEVGGSLKVASFNLLNYFNGDGAGGGFPTPRGAESPTEFQRQQAKTIEAILGLNADVFGYNEMENDGYGPTSAVQQLVDALNAATAPGTYSFVIPPESALTSGRFGGDEITVGFIYKTNAVRIAPGTNPAALTTGAFAQDNANRVQRPALAVTFERLEGGTPTRETFTAIINHFKSKGSPTGRPEDADFRDGQGFSNGSRTRASQELAAWLATNPTGTTDPDYLIMGDLNAYRFEDPITTLTNAGYTSLFGPQSYSYQFQGQWGSLDHALASGSLASQVTGAAKWHINADEPVALDYNLNFKSAAQQASFYSADPFASSDHDPLVVGLNLTATVAPGTQLFGGNGPDVLSGTDGADYLDGGNGDDVLSGNAGDDTLIGGNGADRLTGGLGSDRMTGGNGPDRFILTSLNESRLSGFDVITDFHISSDILDGPNPISAASVAKVGAAASLSAADIGAVLTASSFAANGAAVFTLGSGSGTRTFVALNDGAAGFSASTDAVIEITGYSGSINALAIA
ncbi:MAG TPA: ExeM/NucH family extracellular endonuclease [Trichocoleus sp.]